VNGKPLFQDIKDLKALAEFLSESPVVVTSNEDDPRKEAWELAHTLSDLEESFRKCLDFYFPRLKDQSCSPSEVKDLLLDIGEELRHILYHIENARFYDYLLAPKAEA
jgi:hypothetical protein